MPMPPFPARDRIASPQGLLTESWRQWLARVQDTLGALTGGTSGTGLVLTGPPARGDATQLLWIAADGEVRQGTLASSDMPMISETTISNGSLLARVADNEAITGAWTFGTLPGLPPQAAHLVWAGPTSGSAAPGFRALVDDDVPETLTLSQILGASTAVAGTLRVTGNLGVHGGSLFAHAPLAVTTSEGDLTLAPAANLKLGPAGGTTIPTTPYGVALGTLQAKFRSLAVGELFAETLVAQETVATIGGRIVVCPTTALVADLAAGATTLTVKHNNLADGDVLYMESAGVVEFLRVTSAATGEVGAWSYTVERDKDGGPGGHAWAAGDAVVNTGQAGAGFIDLYSVRGLKSHLEAGPTIVGNVRTASGTSDTDPLTNAHAAWAPRWAVGNLNGLYGYGADTYGCAFGDPDAAHILIDPTNGIRLRHAATDKIVLDASGDASFTGAITAGSGTIGGWTIGATELTGTNVTLHSTAGLEIAPTTDLSAVSAYKFASGDAGGWFGTYGFATTDARTLSLKNEPTDTTHQALSELSAEVNGYRSVVSALSDAGTTDVAYVYVAASHTSGATSYLDVRSDYSAANVAIGLYAAPFDSPVGPALRMTGERFEFRTSDVERLRIAADGAVTIDGTLAVTDTTTLTPGATGDHQSRVVSTTGLEWHLRAASGKDNFLSFTEDNVADRWTIKSLAGSGSLIFASGSPTSATDRVTIDSSGQVGIGGAPGERLRIVNTLAGAQSDKRLLLIVDGYNAGANGQYFAVIGGTGGINLVSDYGRLSLGARNDGATTWKETVTVTSDDRVGIGTTAPDTRLDIDAGALEFAEMTEPSAPASNGARLYVKDNGAGKTQLCVRFATGAVQVIATEP